MNAAVASQTTVTSSDATFLANRATGRIEIVAASAGGETRRRHVAESGSLRVRFPTPQAEDLEAVIINTAGGIAGGDRFEVDITVEDGAKLVVTTAAAEKIYRSLAPKAEIGVKLTVGAGARLLWLPQEMILFDRGRVSRRIDVELAGDATLVLAEMSVFGRSAMGEVVERGSFADYWRVRRDGRLLFAESLRLDGTIAEKLSEPSVTASGVAVATMLMVPGDEQMTANVRALNESFQGEVGISTWNGMAVARFCAKDGANLRHDVVAALTALGAPLPRIWLN